MGKKPAAKRPRSEATAEGATAPATTKAKAVLPELPAPGGLLTRVLNGEEAAEALQAEVANAAPYPHGVLTGLCDDAFLRRVREEAIDNLPATFKETDLFKMYQTVDVRPSPMHSERGESAHAQPNASGALCCAGRCLALRFPTYSALELPTALSTFNVAPKLTKP
jgi:hypothetical protein